MNDGVIIGPLLDLDDCYEYETGATSFLINSTNEERIKVDRRTLENMIQDPATNSTSTVTETAAEFFQRVMQETNTQIIWPSKLKVGAKSKKDPHIKIYGEPDAIQNAKTTILEIFDIKKNRVTMKMDVSYTDHSHVIGKGGKTIQQVMDDTGCHIHFPDSNRNTNAEKSNQVSIAGPAVGVEKARCRIRGLLPLVLTFEIPHPIPDFASSAIIQMIFQSFGFMATSRPLRGGGYLVMVRGSCRQLASVQQGVSLLMSYLASNCLLPPVTLRTEIAPQHHAFVLGPLGCNLKLIMRTTGCSIVFPDPNVAPPPCVMYPGHTKSTVAITGSFDAVYTAWQLLIGYLPLVMMFDLREGQDIPPVLVTQLVEHYKVSISIRPKRKENIKTVMVRGPEYSSKALFEVRRHLLELDESEVPTCCERHSAGNPLATYFSQMAFLSSATTTSTQQQQLRAGAGGWPSQSYPQQPSACSPSLLSLLLALETPPQPTPKFSAPWEHGSSSSSGFSTPNLSPRHSPLHFHQTATAAGGFHYPPSALQGADFRPQWQVPEPPDEKFLPEVPGSNGLLASNFKDSASLGYGSMTDLNDFPEPPVKLMDYGEKKLLATKAMQKPIGSEARSPTGVWSGCGFSRSVPEGGWGREWVRQEVFGLSNQFEGVLGRPAAAPLAEDLPQALVRAGLAKYIDAFLNAEVDLDTFLTMTDSDFQNINIPFGARRKMMLLQHELCSKKTFQAAPGAERRKMAVEDRTKRGW